MPSVAERILAKTPLPTHLDSATIRARVAVEIRQRAFFSARMTSMTYLKQLQTIVAAYAHGEVNAADARWRCQQVLGGLGLDSGGHSLADHGSARRLNLILETQRKMATSVARLDALDTDELEDWPAWRLERYGSRAVPREDWHARWKRAGDACGWVGAVKGDFVALKTSPIWAALGQGAGGFKDTLGNPYPPFAYGSGLDWSDVSAEEATRLGLTLTHQTPQRASLAPDEREILEAMGKTGLRPEDLRALNAAYRKPKSLPKRCPKDGGFETKEGGCNHPSHDGTQGKKDEQKPARDDGSEQLREPTQAERERSQRITADWIDSFKPKMSLEELGCSKYEGKAFLAGNPEINTSHGKVWFPNSKLGKFGDGKGRAPYKKKRQERVYALLDPNYTPDFSGKPAPQRFTEAKVAVYTLLHATSYTDKYKGGQQLFYREFGDLAAVVICSKSGMVNTYFVDDKRKVPHP